MNLLQNPSFEFHSFSGHRTGAAKDFESGYAAFWNSDAFGDTRILREAHLDGETGQAIRPAGCVHNLAAIKPGRRLWQFFTLSEAGLAHGDRLCLTAGGYQSEPGALRAIIRVMKTESSEGQWKPKDFGQTDERIFQKHGRGELVAEKEYSIDSARTGAVELVINAAEITGHFKESKEARADDINTVGIEVVFENRGEKEAWVHSPRLTKGAEPAAGDLVSRPIIPYYRHIPRTIQKLWKGEALHIMVMGSSIDRGSANPPLYCYDEDPSSPSFKQPVSADPHTYFEASKVNRPDLAGYVGQWRHYWSYAGRLRLELMRKFDLPVEKILLNFMACDGSCVAESHSGLGEYCSLAVPPQPEMNGYPAGKTWQELHPEIFSRPGGPGPDLVIFGSGANEKVDTPDEVAVFEGAIRWIQRHYPGCEFLFCQFQNRGGYTPNCDDLRALALRYQIPALDAGKALDDVTRWCNYFTLTPDGGHPQAAAHYLWFKQMEKAFECWNPTEAGQLQARLPERLHPNSYGWEGEMATFAGDNARINGGRRFILEDTALNAWASVATNKVKAWIDGQPLTRIRGNSIAGRDIRNASFSHGNLSLGDRHILEIDGDQAKINAVDCKVCPNRLFLGVDSGLWRKPGVALLDYSSEWGAPYGSRQARLKPGQVMEIEVIAADISIAYVNRPEAGALKITVDGAEKATIPADQPFTDIATNKLYLENRKGITGLGYGLHTVRLEAAGKPVDVLGIFTYDSRPNQLSERRLRGFAAPGDIVAITAPFRVRPLVFCQPPLAVDPQDIRADRVTFSGKGPGIYEVIGE
ncbi:MAG: SGNH/GDSL hydrolase family protein [Kiritimatiellia bacterium]